MKSWPVQDAKARFSELLAACAAQGPQMVTKRGVETAVLVPAAEWHRIQQRSRPTLKQLLLSERARGYLAITARGARKRRVAKALSMFLLDPNIVSDLRPAPPHRPLPSR